MVSQDYATRVNDFDVIQGNSAIMKCEIPSFVTDFVSVINWSDNNNAEFYSSQNTMGKKKSCEKKSFNTSLAGDTQALQVGDKKMSKLHTRHSSTQFLKGVSV